MEEKHKVVNQLMNLGFLIVSGFPWVPLCSKDAIFRQGWLLTCFDFVHFRSQVDLHGVYEFTLKNNQLPITCSSGLRLKDRYLKSA